MDLNLDTLKQSIAESLNAGDFAVYRSSPGALEGLPMVIWDTAQFPDYQMFLDVARQAGVKLMLFASRSFEAGELDELAENLDECGFTREERRDVESRLRDLRRFDGVTCSLELAFDYQNRLHVYELRPDWYEEYLTLEEELMMAATGGEDEGDDDSLGGYYSKN